LQAKVEFTAWRISTVILLLISALEFFTQRFVFKLFPDLIFETCIFYIPTAVIVVLFIYFWRKQK